MIDMPTLPIVPKFLLMAGNFCICSFIGWACVCRISKMSKRTTLARFRLVYAALFVAATASGFSLMLFHEWPGPGQIAMGASMAYMIWMSARLWTNGPPEYARKPQQQDFGNTQITFPSIDEESKT